jgi:hypothetical protein
LYFSFLNIPGPGVVFVANSNISSLSGALPDGTGTLKHLVKCLELPPLWWGAGDSHSPYLRKKCDRKPNILGLNDAYNRVCRPG